MFSIAFGRCTVWRGRKSVCENSGVCASGLAALLCGKASPFRQAVKAFTFLYFSCCPGGTERQSLSAQQGGRAASPEFSHRLFSPAGRELFLIPSGGLGSEG